jgi:hypothetical protein
LNSYAPLTDQASYHSERIQIINCLRGSYAYFSCFSIYDIGKCSKRFNGLTFIYGTKIHFHVSLYHLTDVEFYNPGTNQSGKDNRFMSTW